MAHASHIQSETVRRLVIGLIMAALLAASTALAAMMSRRAHVRQHPPMTASQLGAFSLERPTHWKIQPAVLKPQPGLGTSAAFIENDGERRLILAELRYDQPVAPNHALDDFLGDQFPAPSIVLDREFRRHGPICGMIAALKPDEPGKGWQFVATFTLDGRRHVAISLIGPDLAEAADLLLVNTIARTIVDKRYDAMDTRAPIPLADAATLAVPQGLSAFRLNEPDQPVPRYMLTSGSDFFTLELAPLPANFARGTSELSTREHPDVIIRPALADAPTEPNSTALTPNFENLDEMLVTVLRWNYRNVTGAYPTQPIMVGRNRNQAFFALQVGFWKPLATWIEFLAVRLETGRGVLLDVTASPSVSDLAEKAAFIVAHRITPVAPLKSNSSSVPPRIPVPLPRSSS